MWELAPEGRFRPAHFPVTHVIQVTPWAREDGRVLPLATSRRSPSDEGPPTEDDSDSRALSEPEQEDQGSAQAAAEAVASSKSTPPVPPSSAGARARPRPTHRAPQRAPVQQLKPRLRQGRLPWLLHRHRLRHQCRHTRQRHRPDL